MIVTCDGCGTKYLLGDDKVPERGIRVRCPKCAYVWRLMLEPVESFIEVRSGAYTSDIPVEETAGTGWGAMEQLQPTAETVVEAVENEMEISEERPVAREPVSESPEFRKKRERARRLARVFASDILEYNKEKRNQGLANGDLMTVLGPEIKKAWEAYKQKIGSDFVESSDYFREALNDILADGQNVF